MKTLVFALMAIFALPQTGFAQQQPAPAQPPADWLGRWERAVAAPSYGLAALIMTIRAEGPNGSKEVKTLTLPGLDLRLFQGTNVEQRGGFFVGWEVGLMTFFAPSDAGFKDSYPASTTQYDVSVDSSSGLVFGLVKYGYRLDLGLDVAGVSLGADMGIGMRMFNGYLKLFNKAIGTPTAYYAKRSWDTGGASVDLCLDLGAEATFRFGKNFRLFAKGGILFTPPIFDSGDTSNFFNSGATSFTGPGNITTEQAANSLFSRYKLDLLPIIPNIRAGFSVSY